MAKEYTEQLELFEDKSNKEGPVTCLGMTFENDEARRAYFTEELRKKLPELRQIEGFPIGEDEDILALSDPPYYTACPNPFINDFMNFWEQEKKELIEEHESEYRREPFAADVSEGKTDPIYNAHSYHTKVPHKAIMRYLMHYTSPGDIVFDGFCGTGMTGLAANLCGDRNEVESLGYKISENDTVYDSEGNIISKLGKRRAIINDLSPAATFISYNLNTQSDIVDFQNESKKIVEEVNKECGWMYETNHEMKDDDLTVQSKKIKGTVNYIIWSDVFVCPECNEELVFWDIAVEKGEMKIKEKMHCPSCSIELSKKNMQRAFETFYDSVINRPVQHAKQVPVLINYFVGKKNYIKKPDNEDLNLINKINENTIPFWFPNNELPFGYNTQQPMKSHGYTHAHHFYTKRNLWVLASFWNKSSKNKLLRFAITSILIKTASKLHNIGIKDGKINLAGALPNVLFIPSNLAERNIIRLLEGKIRDIIKADLGRIQSNNIISTMSFGVSHNNLDKEFVDYIFVDPPFGSNLMYSELNYLWEAWHKVFTENTNEAIENKIQNKSLSEYHKLMTSAFKKAYEILKPGHWMTIEFSNTKASVWNVIQSAVEESGFVVANVSALNKGQGTYYSQTNPTSVTQDLVISAYKPVNEVIIEIKNNGNNESSIWLFVRRHLEQLPIFNGKNGAADIIIERTPRVLFDRMVAYHFQNGYSVPMSSAEFQLGVTQRFPMRDGMVFLENQVAKYDKKRIQVKEFIQMNLFVSDEISAIEWLRQQLLKKPQSRQELHSGFMKEIQHISKYDKLPELDVLLEQNFIQYNGVGPVPSQIHAYLSTNFKELRGLDKEDLKLKSKALDRWYVPDPNKQADLEKLREKSLLREFDSYVEEIGKSKKKLKQFRLEAIRAGFKKAWGEKDYKTIVEVGGKIPENVLQEDDKLLMYYDNAQIRLGI